MTPPPPSPKITQVSLSLKSKIDVMVSTPITITLLYCPEVMKLAPVTKPYKKPEQAALRSKPQAFFALIFF